VLSESFIQDFTQQNCALELLFAHVRTGADMSGHVREPDISTLPKPDICTLLLHSYCV